jgi:hypothetical protein
MISESTPAPLTHARGCLCDCIEPSNIHCDAARRLSSQSVRDNLQEFRNIPVLRPWYIVSGGRYLRCVLRYLKEESISDWASLLYATNCLSPIIPHLHCRLYNAWYRDGIEASLPVLCSIVDIGRQ